MLDLYICVANKLRLMYPFFKKIGPDGIYGFFFIGIWGSSLNAIPDGDKILELYKKLCSLPELLPCF